MPSHQSIPSSAKTPTIPTASPDLLSDLSHLKTLLHLFHHRNNLQHRHATWYRHFSTFRRHLSRLENSFAEMARRPETHTARLKKRARDKSTTSRIGAELDLWASVLVARWWSAFSQVAADGRFAVLGVFLLAVLAQVAGLTGTRARIDEANDEETVAVLRKFEEEGWARPDHVAEEVGVGRHEADDEGVAVRREVEDLGEEIVREDMPVPVTDTEVVSVPAPRTVEGAEIARIETNVGISTTSGSKSLKRAASKSARDKDRPKKKTKKNAIDQLFSGL